MGERKLTDDMVATWLIQECAEVQQAATKCLIYGFNQGWHGYGRNNDVLSKEVGDLLGIVGELRKRGMLTASLVESARRTKVDRMKKSLVRP